jgi:putative chitinase
MKLTPSLLTAAVGCTPALAERYAGPLSEACERFGITTPGRLAMFLANLGHESAGLAKQRESMDYAADRLVAVFGSHRITQAQADAIGRKVGQKANQEAIANQVYGGEWGRKNLGNTQPGDGWRYRAAGPIGTTGRSNFRELRAALLLAGYDDVPDFEAEPERLTEPLWGAAAAGHFWSSRSLNAYADAGDFDAVCKGINLGNPKSSGTPNGMADRRLRFSKAMAALNDAIKDHATPAEAPVNGAPPAPEPAPSYMPAGEIIPEVPMPIPAALSLLPIAIDAIGAAVPSLIRTFGSGSAMAERNAKAAEMVVDVAKQAANAVNEQDLIERMQDPATREAVKQAVHASMGDFLAHMTRAGEEDEKSRVAALDRALALGKATGGKWLWLLGLSAVSILGFAMAVTWEVLFSPKDQFSDAVKMLLLGQVVLAGFALVTAFLFGTNLQNRVSQRDREQRSE